MDNSNIASKETPLVVPSDQNPAASTQPSVSGGSNNKIVVFFIAGFIVTILAVGGIYMYLNNQQKTTTEPVVEASNTNTPVAPKPAEVKDALDADLEAINVTSGEEDFKSVDSDLQSL